MEKRFLLFVFLAFLIFFAWNLAFPPPRVPDVPPQGPSVTAPVEPGIPAGADASVLSAPGVPALAESSERELELRVGTPRTSLSDPIVPGAYRARFSNRGARLLALDLADYVRTVGLDEAQRGDAENWLPLVESIETATGRTGSLLLRTSPSSVDLAPGDLDQALWTMEKLAAPEQGVRFRYGPPGGHLLFEKSVRFEPGTWHLLVTLAIQNVDLDIGATGRTSTFLLEPVACVPAELNDRFYREPTAIAIGRARASDPYASAPMAAASTRNLPGDLSVPKPLAVVGEHNKYFAFLLREAVEGRGTLRDARYVPVIEQSPVPRALVSVEVPVDLALPAPGQTQSYEYVVYAGPKDPEPFTADCAAHQLVIDDDLTMDSIAKALLHILRLLDGVFGNWGVAIIALTLCVRAALFPLNRRSQTTMARYQKKMKRVQPKLEEIKKRFENEPQKLREVQARIMQEEGAFPPLGGCLPIFLQMPIFFGLFSALRTSFDLRQAPFFGWIHDLSRPDHLLHLGWNVPLVDLTYLNVLPILMVVLWVLQQRTMPKPADEQAARMQKMMAFMPVVFGFMLYGYAAGLSLYMITTSSCSILEQKVIKKLWPIDDTEQEKKKERAGCGPFSGAMQHLAEKQREQMKRMQAMQNERRRKESRKRS